MYSYGSCLGNSQSIDPPYSFYIVPQLPVSVIYKAWEPVLQNVGSRLGICFNLIVPSSIPIFEDEIKAGKPDFAFMNPYHLFLPEDGFNNYIPILADSTNKLFGIVVIKSNSKILKIQDLNGQKIAFPSPNAFAASLLIRAYLQKHNVKFIPEYVKTHSNVYRSVIVGDVTAGGGVNNTLKREPNMLQRELKILFKTPEYMPHPIAVNTRVSQSFAKEMAQYFIELSKDPDLEINFDAIQIPTPIKVSINDYEEIKKLQLNLLRFGENVR